jgi:uncharacterized protein
MTTTGNSGEQEGDRLKSVSLSALTDARDEDGGALRGAPVQASPAPTVNAKQSVGVKAALTALRIYKVYFSILFAGNCRFQPTCSTYMYEAIERFGVMRGSWMGLKRLLRCQPLSRKFGYDPVPEIVEMTASESDEDGPSEGRSGVSPREAHS